MKDLFEKNIKKDLHCIIKNAIKVSPFPYDTGCFHRTDDTTNAKLLSVGYSPLLASIIHPIQTLCQGMTLPTLIFFTLCCQNTLFQSRYLCASALSTHPDPGISVPVSQRNTTALRSLFRTSLLQNQINRSLPHGKVLPP